MVDLQPRLCGSRVALRPLVADDWQALYAVASDPLIWAGHPAKDRWREPVFREFFEETLSSGGALAATDPETGAMFGTSRFDPRRAEPGEVEIGWTFIARGLWGGGVNAEMKRLMVAYALERFDLVIFMIGETNIRSQKAVRNIGARLSERTHDVDMGFATVRHVIYEMDRRLFDDGPLCADLKP